MTGINGRANAARLLVVSESEGSAVAIVEFLKECEFSVELVSNSKDALEELHESQFEVMLIDVDLRDMTGANLVDNALAIDEDLAILAITDLNDATSAAICLQRGAFDYLTKPLDLERLRLAVDRSIRHRGTRLQSEQISEWLKQELVARTEELERQRRKLEQVNIATLGALINALEAKDPDFIGHSVRVSDLSAMIAAEMELSDDEVEAVRAAGRLHDIGKVGVRDAVLKKKGPLTTAEQQHIKDQVVVGFQILSPLEHLGAVREYVRSHHEHVDGSGYPDGLKGEEIPVGARIICAAEIFDAITSPRPYQEELKPQRAMELMERLAGAALDRRVVNALGIVVARKRTLIYVDGNRPT